MVYLRFCLYLFLNSFFIDTLAIELGSCVDFLLVFSRDDLVILVLFYPFDTFYLLFSLKFRLKRSFVFLPDLHLLDHFPTLNLLIHDVKSVFKPELFNAVVHFQLFGFPLAFHLLFFLLLFLLLNLGFLHNTKLIQRTLKGVGGQSFSVLRILRVLVQILFFLLIFLLLLVILIFALTLVESLLSIDEPSIGIIG